MSIPLHFKTRSFPALRFRLVDQVAAIRSVVVLILKGTRGRLGNAGRRSPPLSMTVSGILSGESPHTECCGALTELSACGAPRSLTLELSPVSEEHSSTPQSRGH